MATDMRETKRSTMRESRMANPEGTSRRVATPGNTAPPYNKQSRMTSMTIQRDLDSDQRIQQWISSRTYK